LFLLLQNILELEEQEGHNKYIITVYYYPVYSLKINNY